MKGAPNETRKKVAAMAYLEASVSTVKGTGLVNSLDHRISKCLSLASKKPVKQPCTKEIYQHMQEHTISLKTEESTLSNVPAFPLS